MISRDYDAKVLQTFLAKVGPRMISELNEEEDAGGVFRNYVPNWEDLDLVDEVHTVLTLPSPPINETLLKSEETSSSLAVLDCQWNCTGNLIAISYGRLNTLGWCDFGGSKVNIWNVFREKKIPDLEMEVLSDIISLAFHPKLPNM